MNVSIGVFAHNEQKAIGRNLAALTTQLTSEVNINEIIVVSSSNDRTDEIVREFDNVQLVQQKKRNGKANAINEFLKIAKSDNLVLCSADVSPNNDAIESMCKMLNDSVGIVGCRPVPSDGSGAVGAVVELQWQIHHGLSLNEPKFGEMIAFKKRIDHIGNTAADEEHVAMLLKRDGYQGAYCQTAIVKNTGPYTIRDFVHQKRRIFWGHLELWSKYNYRVASMRWGLVMEEYLKTVSIRNVHIAALAFILEGSAMTLGIIDWLTNKKHYVWKMATDK